MAIDAMNKKGIHHMVKVISFWESLDYGIFTFELDSDGCQGTNVSIADGVDYLLKKIDQEEEKRKLQSVNFDSGGSGVGSGLVKSLQTVHRIKEDYIMSTCSLHALSLMLVYPIANLIGLGGLGKITAIQLLFTYYYL